MNQNSTAHQEAKVVPMYAYQTVQVAEVSEQLKIIRAEFAPFFEKFKQLFKVAENRFLQLEQENGWTANVINFNQGLDLLESILPSIEKANEYFTNALEKMPDVVIEEIFTTVCDNPNVVLEIDALC